MQTWVFEWSLTLLVVGRRSCVVVGSFVLVLVCIGFGTMVGCMPFRLVGCIVAGGCRLVVFGSLVRTGIVGSLRGSGIEEEEAKRAVEVMV